MSVLMEKHRLSGWERLSFINYCNTSAEAAWGTIHPDSNIWFCVSKFGYYPHEDRANEIIYAQDLDTALMTVNLFVDTTTNLPPEFYIFWCEVSDDFYSVTYEKE